MVQLDEQGRQIAVTVDGERSRGLRRLLVAWRRPMATAAVLAATSTLLFGALHALLIEPIWTRLLGGLPFALLASVGMVWCYSELRARGALPPRVGSGAFFGVALWLALLPMTALAAYIRAAGLRPKLGTLELVLELLVASATGALAAFPATRSARAALAGAGCMVGLVLAMAGPIAVGVGDVQRLLFVGFLPILVASGGLLAAIADDSEPLKRRLARWVSIVGHPFVVAMVLVVAVALHVSTPREALRTLLLVTLITLVPLAVLMARQVRRGSWTNVDASNPAERPLLFAVAAVALATLLVIVTVTRSGSLLVRGALAGLLMFAVSAVATRWIKVSLHVAFGAFAAAALLALGSPAGWALLAVLPALAWSRLALGRHRFAEVAIGLLVGIAFGFAMTSL